MMPAVEIVRRRWTLVAVVRIGSMLIAGIAIFPIVAWFAEGIMDGDLLDLYYYLPQIIFAMMFIALGTIGFFLAGPIVRIATPVRSQIRCPKCQYELLAPREPLCPECGLEVTSLWEPVAPSAALSDAAWRARVTTNVSSVLRLIGFVVGFYTVLHFLWAMAWSSFFFQDEPWRAIFAFIWPVIIAAGSVALIFSAGWLARRIVPSRSQSEMCLVCGYPIGEGKASTCPECGTALQAPPPKPPTPPSQGPAGGDHVPGEPYDEHPDKH